MQQVSDCKRNGLFQGRDRWQNQTKILISIFSVCLVTARKGVGLVCADYHGPQYKVESSDSSQNDEESSAEYEDVSDKSIFKTEKVIFFARDRIKMKQFESIPLMISSQFNRFPDERNEM